MRPHSPEAHAGEIVGLLDDLRQAVERINRGEWRLLVMGPTNASEREEARMFHARLLELISKTCRVSTAQPGGEAKS